MRNRSFVFLSSLFFVFSQVRAEIYIDNSSIGIAYSDSIAPGTIVYTDSGRPLRIVGPDPSSSQRSTPRMPYADEPQPAPAASNSGSSSSSSRSPSLSRGTPAETTSGNTDTANLRTTPAATSTGEVEFHQISLAPPVRSTDEKYGNDDLWIPNLNGTAASNLRVRGDGSIVMVDPENYLVDVWQDNEGFLYVRDVNSNSSQMVRLTSETDGEFLRQLRDHYSRQDKNDQNIAKFLNKYFGTEIPAGLEAPAADLETRTARIGTRVAPSQSRFAGTPHVVGSGLRSSGIVSQSFPGQTIIRETYPSHTTYSGYHGGYIHSQPSHFGGYSAPVCRT